MKKDKKTRLHFGAVFPSLDNTGKYRLLQGIEDYACEHDIHITAYFGTYEAKKHAFASHYEPCFEAIKSNSGLDGVVIYSGFIAHNIGTEAFFSCVNLISQDMPVVSIGVPIPGAYCVIVDNESAMYNAVNHLIQAHGKRRIAVIKGPDGHPEAEARLSGYLRALAENGIEPDDNLIMPGNWISDSGREAVIELLDVRKARFDAIASTDDDSALCAIDSLKERGFSVPEEISVIGFNDIEDAAYVEPSLSTIRQDFSKYGVVALDALKRIIRGQSVDNTIQVVPEFIMRRSCGCEAPSVVYRPRERPGEKRRRMVSDNLLLQFNLESLGNTLRESLPIVSVKFALIGIYQSSIRLGASENDRTICTLFGFDDLKKISISGADMPLLPFSNYTCIKNVDFERERRTLFFLPLFFGDEESGEALIAYNRFNPVEWYEILRRNIAVAVKGASLFETIQALSITDELTGLLNRRGFFQHVYARLLYLQRANENISVVFALDMDGLKSINDTYGHAEGDAAISAFAEILKNSVRMEDIIGRIGGDEFVIFSVVKSENDVDKLESRIRNNLDAYNALKKHPYTVRGSIGSSPLSTPTNEAFDQAMLDADNYLYAEKQEKRKKGLSR